MKKLFLLTTLASFIVASPIRANTGSRVKAVVDEGKVRLVFVGDIMVHGPQIRAAYDAQAKRHDFAPCFDSLRMLLSDADLTIGNLETTFAGKPYSGYPMFSSPDALGTALRDAGFDLLTTANNHSADRHTKGIVRTLDVLDSLGVKHTGSYRSASERASTTPLIVEAGGIRLGILAYTYGTNGIAVRKPTIVDTIDLKQIRQDLEQADILGAEIKIVQIHWGVEYQTKPNDEQLRLADSLRKYGANLVIGSHPHVVQRMQTDTTALKPYLVIYSLGNFISNQIKPASTRGGAVLSVEIERNTDSLGRRLYTLSAKQDFVFVQKRELSGRSIYRLRHVDLEREYIPLDLPETEQADLKAFIKYIKRID